LPHCRSQKHQGRRIRISAIAKSFDQDVVHPVATHRDTDVGIPQAKLLATAKAGEL
jgi:hypothetical protein